MMLPASVDCSSEMDRENSSHEYNLAGYSARGKNHVKVGSDRLDRLDRMDYFDEYIRMYKDKLCHYVQTQPEVRCLIRETGALLSNRSGLRFESTLILCP